jgi:hypothetical protein
MATVILLETDRLEDSLAGRAAAPGLLPVGGRPLVYWAARAFAACGDVEKIVLAGPTAYDKQPAALAAVDETLLLDAPLRDLAEAVLERYGEAEELLIWRPNAPLITPEMVEHFLAHAPADAALTVAMVRAGKAREVYPAGEEPPAYALRGESVVFPLLLSLKPAAVTAQMALLRRLISDHLVQSELAKLLGVGLAIAFKSGRATALDLAKRAGELLGAPAVLLFSPYGELALRVRNRAEYHLVRDRLEGAA